MRPMRIAIACLIIVSFGTSAFAGDLASSVAKAAQQEAQGGDKPMPKGYLLAGSALFVGGMAIGVYAFLHNRNGKFPGFEECCATNKPLGAAGLGMAFAGGTILFLGGRQARKSATLTIVPRGLKVSKQLSW
jgi:hypothetical protein